MVTCPECDSRMDYQEEDLQEGDVISCDECGAEFQVVGIDPLELELIEEEEEEEEEDDFLDEEDEDDEDWR